MTDFAWKQRHAVIALRLARWEAVRDASALLRGTELAELVEAAFADDAVREPRLTDAQRTFLLASQRHDAAERERILALYAGAQARSLAFAARDRVEAEPDAALLLGAEAARVAAVPEARAALGLVLHRHAMLLRVNHAHAPAREVIGLAFSPDGAWLASADRPAALNDERTARVLIHDVASGSLLASVPSDRPLSALAWGERWLAVASRDSIGWLRWDEERGRFRSNTPTAIGEDVAPDFLAFSPASAAFAEGEWLAWGTRWGDIGVIRVGDHARARSRVAAQASSDALAGIAWLADGRLLSAEGGRIVVRSGSTFAEPTIVATLTQVYSLSCTHDRWVVAGVTDEGAGLLFGEGAAVGRFMRAGPADIGRFATLAGSAVDADVVVGSRSARSGVPMVALAARSGDERVLLQGDDHPACALAADDSGRFVAAGDAAGRVWIWDRARRSALLLAADAGAEVPRASASIEVSRYTYALVDAPRGEFGQRWQRTPRGVPNAAAQVLYALRDPLVHLLAEAGDEHLVIADGNDLVFMPADAPDRQIRRAAHDNPVKHLAAQASVVVSAACSFEDTRIDVLKLWTAEGDPLSSIALPAHAAGVDIAADGSAVQVIGAGGERWSIPLAAADWAATAEDIAGRVLSDEEARRYRIHSWRAGQPDA